MKRAFLAIILTAGIGASPQPKPEAMLAAGQGHAIVLGPDGSILTWGENGQGQLGDGTRLARTSPLSLQGLRGFSAVAAGGAHTMALKDGAVWIWGSNRYGQLGSPELDVALAPLPLRDLTSVVAISAGQTHSLAVGRDGTVWGWGDNHAGQLGGGPEAILSVPSRVPGLSAISAVSAGGRHSVALGTDGSVWGWGNNAEGQVGEIGIENVPPGRIAGIPRATAVAAGGRHSLALGIDGRVWSWGSNQHGQLGDAWARARGTPAAVSDLSHVKAIAAGGRHSLALKQDGTVWSWGDNRAGQLGDSSRPDSSAPLRVAGLPEIRAIAAGETESIAIATDGTIWIWGGGAEGEWQASARPRALRSQAEPIPEAPDANVATPTFAPDGGSYTPGVNPVGSPVDRLNVTINCSTSGATIRYTIDGSEPSQTPPNGTQVSPGAVVPLFSSLTLKAKGFKAGLNDSATKTGTYTLKVQTPTFSPSPASPFLAPTTVTMACGTPACVIRYTTTGEEPTASSTQYTAPILITLTTRLKAKGFKTDWAMSDTASATYTINYGSVAAGLQHSIALTQGGVVWTWGANGEGQLGLNSTGGSHPLPAQVTAISGVKAIAGGGAHTLVLKTDGTVWGWGRNAEGQLGDKSFVQRLTPVAAFAVTGIAAIAVGENHSIALTTGGTVWTWGANDAGQLGRSTTKPHTPAAISSATLSGIVAIAAGRNHSFALKDNGVLYAWGKNNAGQVGTGSCCTNQLTPVQVAGTLGFITGVAGGHEHSLAITSGGQVWGWGNNTSGQLGINNTNSPQLTPALAIGLANVAATAAGTQHSVAMTTDGTVWTWGAGNRGQLGKQGTTSSSVPVPADTMTGIVAVSAGDIHNLALQSSGVVWAWGGNTAGQIGDGTTIDRFTPVSISEAGFAWKLATPVLTPATGTSSAPIGVMMTDASAGVRIYYTTDGTEPSQSTSPSVTSGTSVGISNSPLKAKAFPFPPNGNQPSSTTAVGTYTFFVADCMFTPGAGGPPLTASPSPIQVFNPTALNVSGVVIHYTTNGADPTESDPTIANFGNVQLDTPVNGTKTLKARAWRPNTSWTPSGITAVTYTMKVGAPVFAPPGGPYGTEKDVTITIPTVGATIHYTTTGVEPTEDDPPVASGGTVHLAEAVTLKARAWKSNWVTSDPTRATYLITAGPVATPTIMPPANTYTSPQTVTLATTTPGATIRYTLDGTDPSWTSPIYGSPFSIAANVTVKAKAFKASSTPSAIASAAYVIDLGNVATPVLSPGSGSYTTKRTVTVTCATPNVTIRYTIDGSDPTTATQFTVASGSTVDVLSSQRLKVMAWDNNTPGLPPSGVRRADYLITGAIAAGDAHSLALKPDGTVWAWGLNNWGQLGNNSTTNSPVPVQVQDPGDPTGKLTGIVAIAAGNHHSLAVKSDGKVVAWGRNFYGQLGINATDSNPHTLPTQVLTGTPPNVVPLEGVVAVAGANLFQSNASFSLALKADGTVYGWGHAEWGELGLGLGAPPATRATQMPGLAGATGIAAAGEASYVLKTDGAPSGTVWMSGRNSSGQLGDGSTTNQGQPVSGLSLVTQIGAGSAHAVAVKSDLTARGWGDNQAGQIGDGAAGELLYRLSPVAIGLTGVRTMAAGHWHTLAVRSNGSLWGWGNNLNYQIDPWSLEPKYLPAPVTNWNDVVAVAAGSSHSMALRIDGTVWTWGANASGQIGDNTSGNNRAIPFQVPNIGQGANSWLLADPDGDGLNNGQELQWGTDPMNPDTNGDGIPDGASVNAGISPTNMDHDGDGLINAVELQKGTDPFLADTDGDGSNDSADCFPLDPTRWTCAPPNPNDHTPPVITLTEPTNAVLISSVP